MQWTRFPFAERGTPIGFNVFLVVSDRLAPSPSCGAAPCRRARRLTAAIVCHRSCRRFRSFGGATRELAEPTFCREICPFVTRGISVTCRPSKEARKMSLRHARRLQHARFETLRICFRRIILDWVYRDGSAPTMPAVACGSGKVHRSRADCIADLDAGKRSSDYVFDWRPHESIFF